MKKTVTITIDENIWELAKHEFGNRSSWIESQMRLALDKEDEEAKIMKHIQKKENEINVLKDKLCRIREHKSSQMKVEGIFDKPMISINRIHEKLGAVGENQIRKIAHANDVPAMELIDFCKNKGFNIVRYLEVPER